MLPSGVPVKVEIVGAAAGDGMASVGIRDLDLGDALDRVGEIGSLVVSKLTAARPDKMTVELHLGFALEAGKLTALWVGGRGEASLTVTMDWSGAPAGPGNAPASVDNANG
jgi:Trypsin-co-occurring domain 1